MKKMYAGALTLCLGLTACSSSSEPDVTEGGNDIGMTPPVVTTWEQPPLPDNFGEVDQASPDEVGRAVITQFFSWDPNTDQSFADAGHRAEALMTPEYVSQAGNSWSAMMSLPGYLWEQWVAEDATIDVTVTDGKDQRPADQEMKAFRQYIVDVTATGKTTTKIQYAVFVELDKLGWWQVSKMNVKIPTVVTE